MNSDIFVRNNFFRKVSYISSYCSKSVIGKGIEGYIEAIDFLAD